MYHHHHHHHHYHHQGNHHQQQVSGSEDEEIEEELETDGRALVERIVVTLRWQFWRIKIFYKNLIRIVVTWRQFWQSICLFKSESGQFWWYQWRWMTDCQQWLQCRWKYRYKKMRSDNMIKCQWKYKCHIWDKLRIWSNVNPMVFSGKSALTSFSLKMPTSKMVRKVFCSNLCLIQGVFLHWASPKKLKYEKPRLDESTLT